MQKQTTPGNGGMNSWMSLHFVEIKKMNNAASNQAQESKAIKTTEQQNTATGSTEQPAEIPTIE